MQKKINSVKAILISLFLSFFLTTTGITQEPVAKQTPAAELKRLWKKNELFFGVGSALLCTLVVYALWRKKKRSISNIDSII